MTKLRVEVRALREEVAKLGATNERLLGEQTEILLSILATRKRVSEGLCRETRRKGFEGGL